MSYYDWEHIVKPLQFGPVTQDTTVNTKPLTVTPVDSIKTGLVSLRIPATTFEWAYDNTYGVNPPQPLIIGQFNYTVATPITFLNVTGKEFDFNNEFAGFYAVAFAVRYRVAGVVTRYLFAKMIEGQATRRSLFPFPSYTNQRILGNFTIEVWQSEKGFGAMIPPLLSHDIYLQTGQIFFPSSYESVSSVIEPVNYATYTELSTALPENLPTVVNAKGPWLTN